jgi:outer membrane protein OmpA-like peptidoglycan-associated protein
MSKLLLAVSLFVALSVPVLAQQDNTQNNIQVQPLPSTPVYRVTVVARTTEAVNYRQLSGSTKIDFRGSTLMPDASGEASIEGKRGKLNIEAKFDHLKKASTLGPEYLTYVLWAITPEGRPSNLGEVIPNDDDKASLTVTTNLQAFGLILTAEPYFAVTQPSDMLVADNVILHKTKGWREPITAKFEALQRGAYTVSIPASQLPSTGNTKHVPLELLEARNAVAIAKASGADKYAPDTLVKAQTYLDRGETYLQQKQSTNAIGTVARGATQAAEDARLLTIRRREQEQIAEQQRAAQQQTEEARARAQTEAARAAAAQAAAATEAQQRMAAEQAQQQAEQAKLQAEQAAQQARQEQAQAEAARQAALQQQQQLQQQAQQKAQQAEQQREQLRTRLQQQLNQVLQTRDTARGLIVNMNDVLFDFNKATLKPGARERLAKVAGIILAYPDLHLQIEGFTDNVGSEQYNLDLSRRRAAVVRDYLISQGVPVNNIYAQGFGKADPVASNSTPEGRQLNRRVDLVVSGEAIGTAVAPTSPGNTPPASASGNAATGGVAGAATSPSSTNPGPTTTGSGTVASPTSAPSATSSNPNTTTPPPQ